MKSDAVVLAGGRNSEAMRAATGVDNRALARLGGRTMLAYVVEALQAARGIGRVFVVGEVPPGEGYQVLAPGETLLDNLLAGLSAAGQERHFLAVTSDIPFLTPEAVDDFTARAAATGADFCYPIIPLAVCREQYPQMRRTSLKVREGVFTGGNLLLLDPGVVREHQGEILGAYAARKRPLRLARMLGLALTLRTLLGQTVSPRFVSIPDLEAGVSRLLGCRAAAVVTQYAEIGTDVDSPEDVAAARALLFAGE